MESLFGHLCLAREFTHDAHMRKLVEDEHRPRKKARYEGEFSQQSTQPSSGPVDDYQSVSVSTHLSGEVSAAKPGLDPELERGVSEIGQTPGQNMIPSSSSGQTPPTPTVTTASQLNIPLQVPKQSREATKAKRDQIRKAHHYLKSANNPSLTIGALPSWSSDEEADPQQHSPHSQPQHQTNPATTDKTSSQSTSTLSIPDSAISSQLDGPAPGLDTHDQNRDTGADKDTPPAPASSAPSLPAPPNLNAARPPLLRASSSRMRVEAYLAARADSYDAWSSTSLLSTGNNHTEEEIEL